MFSHMKIKIILVKFQGKQIDKMYDMLTNMYKNVIKI